MFQTFSHKCNSHFLQSCELRSRCFQSEKQTFLTINRQNLTQLIESQLWFWIKMPKVKREEYAVCWTTELQRLQRLYTQERAVYGFLRISRNANSFLSEGQTPFALKDFPLRVYLRPTYYQWRQLQNSKTNFDELIQPILIH